MILQWAYLVKHMPWLFLTRFCYILAINNLNLNGYNSRLVETVVPLIRKKKALNDKHSFMFIEYVYMHVWEVCLCTLSNFLMDNSFYCSCINTIPSSLSAIFLQRNFTSIFFSRPAWMEQTTHKKPIKAALETL